MDVPAHLGLKTRLVWGRGFPLSMFPGWMREFPMEAALNALEIPGPGGILEVVPLRKRVLL